MTQQRSEVGLLKAQGCLLLVVCLWQWTQQTLAAECSSGEKRVVIEDLKKCCPKGTSRTEYNKPCVDIGHEDCSCSQEYICTDKSCSSCKKLPECAAGKELVQCGNFDYFFECKPCAIGTYSNVKNSRCRNWTDCESFGFQTVKKGNSTHNAVCDLVDKNSEQGRVTNDSLYTTILAIFTAVAVFVLIMLTFFLHFCIWSLKKEKHLTLDNVEHNFPRLPLAPQPSHHREETYSCQFPEEEHGDKTLEEKPCYIHPPILH